MTRKRSQSQVKFQAKKCNINPHQQLSKTYPCLKSNRKATRAAAECHFLRQLFRARPPVKTARKIMGHNRLELRSALSMTLWEISKKCRWTAPTLQKFKKLVRRLTKVKIPTKTQNLLKVRWLHTLVSLKTVQPWEIEAAPRMTWRYQANKKVGKFTKTHLNSASR